MFKAFTDVNRLTILEMLLDGEMCSCAIQDNLTIQQSTLSHHMKILVDSGIVSARKDGKWTYYSISQTGCNIVKKILDYFTVSSTNKCKCSKGDETMGLFSKKKNPEEKSTSVPGASIKILGTGCPNCNELTEETTAALKELGMNTDIEHVGDLVEIVKYGVMSVPALIVDGKIVSVGQLLKKDEIIKILKEVRG